MEPNTIGKYCVWDADLMEGWTNETLADAIGAPLAKVGLDVFEFDVPAGEYINTDIIREQVMAIIEKIVTN